MDDLKRPRRTRISAANLAYRGVPREYHNAHIDEYPIDTDFKDLFSRYMENLEVMFEDKVNLILYGSNGSGKTYLSSLVIKDAYIKRFSSFRVTLQGYIDLQFKKDEEEIREKVDKIENAEFLVLDEVGKETFAKNQFNIIKLEELLRQRDTIGRPTIICTNLPLEGDGGLYKQYGNSIKDLIEGNFLKVEFVGESNRHSVSKKKHGVNLLMGEQEC
jgi:DNA replication protein DnaC